ncbi:MAG TPA: DUF5103 domain-containing protein [Cyclobacteriaceae bacterium]|nr:DUF5103 domain-containing protein [Cyclobacteriaceae bacterium]
MFPPVFHILFAGIISFMIPARSRYGEPGLLVYNDQIYNPNIKSVKLYADNGEPELILNPPIRPINQNYPFHLEFDELYEDARYYQAKIILCNWDWTPSGLNSIEYLDAYNETDITTSKYSVNTKIPYTHYSVILPEVKIPGNYLIYVYEQGNPDNIILSRRYILYDDLLRISPKLVISTGISERSTHQQVEFTIDYKGVESFIPQKDFVVVIRQNYSWVNVISGLAPTVVNEQQKILEYRHFNLENNFQGGNEYRYIDMRSSLTSGRNVARLDVRPEGIDAYAAIDKPRSRESYGFWKDLDGAYYISTVDGNDATDEADYILTHFFLQTGSRMNSDLYLYGEISLRQLLPEFRMSYVPDIGGYTVDVLLKEGYYEYHYLSSGKNYFEVEGNHFDTENVYDIIVYYRPFSRINQLAAGYVAFRTRDDG